MIMGMMICSCGNAAPVNGADGVDSTAVDTTVVDTTAVDSAAVVDSVVAKVAE